MTALSELERMQTRAEWAEQSAHTRGERLNELRAVLGWLESVLRPGADPVEVYLAGLRQPGQPATAFQVEVVPASGAGRFSVDAPTLAGAITAAASRSPAQEATPPREEEQHQGWTKNDQRQEPRPSRDATVRLAAAEAAIRNAAHLISLRMEGASGDDSCVAAYRVLFAYLYPQERSSE